MELKRLIADAQKKIHRAMQSFKQKEKKRVTLCVDSLKVLHQFLQKNQSLWRQLMAFVKEAFESILHIIGVSPKEVTMIKLQSAGAFCRCISVELELV